MDRFGRDLDRSDGDHRDRFDDRDNRGRRDRDRDGSRDRDRYGDRRRDGDGDDRRRSDDGYRRKEDGGNNTYDRRDRGRDQGNYGRDRGGDHSGENGFNFFNSMSLEERAKIRRDIPLSDRKNIWRRSPSPPAKQTLASTLRKPAAAATSAKDDKQSSKAREDVKKQQEREQERQREEEKEQAEERRLEAKRAEEKRAAASKDKSKGKSKDSSSKSKDKSTKGKRKRSASTSSSSSSNSSSDSSDSESESGSGSDSDSSSSSGSSTSTSTSSSSSEEETKKKSKKGSKPVTKKAKAVTVKFEDPPGFASSKDSHLNVQPEISALEMEEAQRFARDYQAPRDEDSDDDDIGPMPMAQPADYADNKQVRLDSKLYMVFRTLQIKVNAFVHVFQISYGGAMRPGEGAAIAAFVQQNLRIPRRGEIGWSGDEIQDLEGQGYVMSGSRHARMNAVRIRKENQVYSAEEKRALAIITFEEKQQKENKVVADFRQMLAQRTGDRSSGSN
jgi:hypothetical protein